MRIITFLLLFGCIHITLRSQVISSGTAISKDTVEYASVNLDVEAFVFGSINSNNSEQGSLFATGPGNGTFTFTWYVYNPGTSSFDLINNETTTNSEISNLSDGSYLVIITDGGSYTDSLHAVVFCDEFDVSITNKDGEGNIVEEDRTCAYFRLRSAADLDSVVYYDVFADNRLVLYDSIVDITWTDDQSDPEYPGISSKELNVLDRASLVEDTRFDLQVTNRYGMIRTDDATLVPIRVRAKFTKEEIYITDKEPTAFYGRYYKNIETRSAPHDVILTNTSSSKVDSILWRFGDGDIGTGDTVLHTYLLPGEYIPKIVVSNDVCSDSIDLTETIKVESSEDAENFVMPNIFVINGSKNFGDQEYRYQHQNYYRSYDVSITHVEIIIVSRFGQLVHEYSGDIREWKGWDGRIKESNRYAKNGVYYYIINEITGLTDDPDHPEDHFFSKGGQKVRTGFFHVFNVAE